MSIGCNKEYLQAEVARYHKYWLKMASLNETGFANSSLQADIIGEKRLILMASPLCWDLIHKISNTFPFVALHNKEWVEGPILRQNWHFSEQMVLIYLKIMVTILVAWPFSGSVDWRALTLTSTSVHLLVLLVCFVLVCCDKWPSFHHRRIKSLNLGARIRIKQVVVEHVSCISQQEERLWHCQVNCPSR